MVVPRSNLGRGVVINDPKVAGRCGARVHVAIMGRGLRQGASPLFLSRTPLAAHTTRGHHPRTTSRYMGATMLGRVLKNRYKLIDERGRGSMATVYIGR